MYLFKKDNFVAKYNTLYIKNEASLTDVHSNYCQILSSITRAILTTHSVGDLDTSSPKKTLCVLQTYQQK